MPEKFISHDILRAQGSDQNLMVLLFSLKTKKKFTFAMFNLMFQIPNSFYQVKGDRSEWNKTYTSFNFTNLCQQVKTKLQMLFFFV